MSGSTEIEIPDGLHIEAEVSDPVPAGDRPKTAREQIMEAAVARANARREEQLALSSIYDADAKAAGLVYPSEGDDAVDEPAPAVAANEPPELVPEPVRVAPAPVEPPQQPAYQAPQVRTINVDGRQFEVTDQQFAELARMGVIANIAVHNYQTHPAPVAQPQYVAPEPVRPLVDPDQVRRVVDRMQFGNADEAAAALTEYTTHLLGSVPAAPQIDPEAIIARAAAVAMAQGRQQQQLAADDSVIRQEYSDIFANPQRTRLAAINVDDIRRRDAQLGVRRADLEIYREAGNMVRDAMNLPRPGSDVETSQPALQAAAVIPREDVIARKREAPRRTAVVDRRAPAPVTPRPPTGSEIVANMRKARGLSAIN